MSINNSNTVERRKTLLAIAGISTYILLLLTLLADSDFVPFSSITTPITAALGQEYDNTTAATPIPSNIPPILTNTASSAGIELSPQPIYQEEVRDVSEDLINQTHAHLIVAGNGTLTLPDSTESIRITSTGSGIVSIKGTFAGIEILTTEDGSENATATFYEIARSNKEEGIGKGIAMAVFHTNSTGKIARLDGMILAGQEEFQPDGTSLTTMWEWQSGIPYVKMQ